MVISMGCKLCKRECNADRTHGECGYCGESDGIWVARAALHLWEEPCICGKAGSGAVFFCGCPLHCVYCQNASISCGHAGEAASPKCITAERLTEIFLSLQSQDACNINLITPTQYIPQIITALKSAKKQGLSIPVVYNTGTYEKPEVLRSLNGLVDIYLPDFKYYSHRLSEKYSAAPDYRETAAAALAEMVRQTGAPIYDENTGLMKSGVIVRHMMLPGHLQDSKRVLSYLRDTYGDTIVYSVMSQYTPVRMFPDMPELNRRVSHREYNALLDYSLSIGIEDGYMQEGEAAESSFIPSFNAHVR